MKALLFLTFCSSWLLCMCVVDPSTVSTIDKLLHDILGAAMPTETTFIENCEKVHLALSSRGPGHSANVFSQGTQTLMEDCDRLYEETTVAQGCANRNTIGQSNLPDSSTEWWKSLTNSVLPGANTDIQASLQKLCGIISDIRKRVAKDADECGGRPAKPKTAIYDWIQEVYRCSSHGASV